MKVSLIDYTGRSPVGVPNVDIESNYAAALLIFTKSTRLEMKPGLFHEVLGWSYDKKLEELKYMANTIPSSWEFCHYTFMIEGVTRAFTHQLVRTRTASFAQQTMRVLNVEGWKYEAGPTIINDDAREALYSRTMQIIADAYDTLVENGTAIEDARGILPTNINTNIVMGANLRTMVEMIRKRSSPRTQGEYREVLDGLKAEMLRVHPWVSLFIERDFDKSAQDLDAKINQLKECDMIDDDDRIQMIKLVDQMRSGK